MKIKDFILPAILTLGMAISCSSPKTKMSLVINFDVEDYITPESEGIDDIPKWLAEIMSEEDVTGTFFVIGEKARSLERRGRRDVIAAMARHDIGSHTNFGSLHPTVTERLEKADWESGVRQMAEQESAGIKELERIFGVPVTSLARHGGSYGPHLVFALGKMKAGYVGSPINLPGKNVVWFCNALNFCGQYDGFDDAYYRDDLFEPLFEKLKAELPQLAKTVDVLPLFAGHPCKIRTLEFWDLNFYDGRDTPPSEWKTPSLRPLESMKTAQKNFRRLMSFLRSRGDIEITTFRALKDRYGRQKDYLTQKDLRKMAQVAVQKKAILPGEDFSPAEAFAGLAESIIDYRNTGSLPRKLKTVRPLGPSEIPASRPEISRVTLAEVYDLAGQVNDHIRKSSALPSSAQVGNLGVGAGSLYALFSAVYLDLDSKKTSPDYEVFPFDPYPRTNEDEIVRRVNDFKSWPVHRRDLDMSRIVAITKMQLWTLKPAHRRRPG